MENETRNEIIAISLFFVLVIAVLVTGAVMVLKSTTFVPLPHADLERSAIVVTKQRAKSFLSCSSEPTTRIMFEGKMIASVEATCDGTSVYVELDCSAEPCKVEAIKRE